MSAPLGNQFWKARATHGRDKIFADKFALQEACHEYFEWVEANPLIETKAFHSQGEITYAEIPKMRAMTLSGLCIFLDISRQTWSDYREREDFIDITSRVEEAIYEQKFTGAAADLLNANIIARDLGLSDKQEVKQVAAIKVDASMSAQDAAKAYQDLMNA